MPTRGDRAFADYLAKDLYHPRSSKHGDRLCEFLLLDLLLVCPAFRKSAEAGRIAFAQNYTIGPDSPDRWNADLVVGPPASGAKAGIRRIGPLLESIPSEIWIAVDAKTVMTEHGKARRNRQRDLNSFQDILHRKNPKTIVGGLLVANVAGKFLSPLRDQADGPTTHHNVERLVEEIVTMLGGLARATSQQAGLEALGVIVVSHTNVPGEPSSLVTEAPAPDPRHPLNYAVFLNDLCRFFSERYC